MQMAWLSREEEALDRIREHLEESNHNVRMEFLEAVTRAVFPRLGVIGAQTRWITRGDVTRITLWGRQHLLNNLRVAIIREAMGLGPKHYCIMTSWDPSFESKLLLLMRYLPEEKMSFYSWGRPLRGPFREPRWQARGEAIRTRSIPYRELPPSCPRCHAWWCNGRDCLPLNERNGELRNN